MNACRYYWPLLGLNLLLGCGQRQPPGRNLADPQGSAASTDLRGVQEQLSGKVFVTGNEPWTSVTLVPPKGGSVTLVGDLQRELAQLSGATVRIWGAHRGKPGTGDFLVKDYEVLEVDGEMPKVGILTLRNGTLRLAGRDTLELLNPPEQLRQEEGTKVWIVGHPVGKRLAVQSYGIIREAGK